MNWLRGQTAQMHDRLEQSYRWCAHCSKQSMSNFYYAFFLLPPAKRRSMHALYAFLRHADDLGDGPAPPHLKQESLNRLRQDLQFALQGESTAVPFGLALADTVARHRIPHEYLFDALDGVAMDLDHRGFETFQDLEQYCYRVASVVGLACIHIWGYRDERALQPARQCGLAFQLTNILRDLKEDAGLGRVYLPREDLCRFDYSEDDLQAGVCDQRFQDLMEFEIARAEALYEQAAGLAPYLYWDGRRILHCMLSTYRGLLQRIKHRHQDVFQRRVRLSSWQKWQIAARSLMTRPHYALPAADAKARLR